METIIVICLLIIIVLLIQDKIIIVKRVTPTPKQQKVNPDLPDIMGQPKLLKRLSMPKTAYKSQLQKQEIKPNNLVIEYDENENVGVQILQEELVETSSNQIDYEEEEEEWNNHRLTNDDNGFAQGVTFEELNTVGILLQKETLVVSQKEIAVDIVQRIQGTELFSLLENSMESASHKIAVLLDDILHSKTDTSSSILRDDDFDIGEFL